MSKGRLLPFEESKGSVYNSVGISHPRSVVRNPVSVFGNQCSSEGDLCHIMRWEIWGSRFIHCYCVWPGCLSFNFLPTISLGRVAHSCTANFSIFFCDASDPPITTTLIRTGQLYYLWVPLLAIYDDMLISLLLPQPYVYPATVPSGVWIFANSTSGGIVSMPGYYLSRPCSVLQYHGMQSIPSTSISRFVRRRSKYAYVRSWI